MKEFPHLRGGGNLLSMTILLLCTGNVLEDNTFLVFMLINALFSYKIKKVMISITKIDLEEHNG